MTKELSKSKFMVMFLARKIKMIGDHSSITSAKMWVGKGGQLLMFADKVGGWGQMLT